MSSQFVAVGRILSPVGVRGEVRAEVLTDFPERFSANANIYIDGREVNIQSCRWHRGRAILKLTGTDDIEGAQKLRGRFLEILESQLRPLPEDEYYQFQLLNLEVWTTDGRLLGQIAQILPTGSNDVLVVPTDKGDLLIPAIEDVVKSVDLDEGRITIDVIDGLVPQKACTQ